MKTNQNSISNENENSFVNQTLPSINNNKNVSRNLGESFSHDSESFDKVFLTAKKKNQKSNNFHPYNKNVRNYKTITKAEENNNEKIKKKKELRLKKKCSKIYQINKEKDSF